MFYKKKQVVDEVRTSFHERVFQTVIPRTVKLAEAPSHGKPILLYDINTSGAVSYMKLGREIMGLPDSGGEVMAERSHYLDILLREPTIGPVHENDTSTSVRAIPGARRVTASSPPPPGSRARRP